MLSYWTPDIQVLLALVTPSSLRNSIWECEKQIQPSCLGFPHSQQSFSPFPALSLWIIPEFLVCLPQEEGRKGWIWEQGAGEAGMGKELLLPNSSLPMGKLSRGLTGIPMQLLQAMLGCIPLFPPSIFLVFPRSKAPTPHLPASLTRNQHRITPWPQAAQEFWGRGKTLA